jgi:2-isopropylmalate synthase
MLVSELSGRGTIVAKARELGDEDLAEDPERVAAILSRLKDLEHRGYHFEVADGSFELLIERDSGGFEPLFEVESFRVITDQREDGGIQTEATVKLVHDGERVSAVAEGNGPVNALDRAVRKALGGRIPELEMIELVNYKVRILNESHGTAATTRVLLDSRDGHGGTWGTIGVSENVIEASWEALLDSLEHGVRRLRRAQTAAHT